MDELETLAHEVMTEIDHSLADNFVKIVLFSRDNPRLRVLQHVSRKLPEPKFGNREHLVYLAKKYSNGRQPKRLPMPKTVPDPALATVMEIGYGKAKEDLEILVEGHRIAMVAENVVGELLERYIDMKLSDDDWIWCAGEVVKSVDFIRRGTQPDILWESLQIKNRDNSENSSSSAIRTGTDIKKWYRTVSRTGETKWSEFPIGSEEDKLDEDDFRRFVRGYLGQLIRQV